MSRLLGIILICFALVGGSYTLSANTSAHDHNTSGKHQQERQHPANKIDPHSTHDRTSKHGKEHKGHSSSCGIEVMLTDEAERQMGGSLYSKRMQTSMKGDKKGMDHSKHKMEEMHTDHETKMGGVFFMASNQMHHLEGTYHKDCGFQLFLYNAFTKPIRVERFTGAIRIFKETSEEVILMHSLAPNKENSILQAPLPSTLQPPFEIELKLKLPGSKEMDVYNFDVDERGKMS